jgi:hypothetical protein
MYNITQEKKVCQPTKRASKGDITRETEQKENIKFYCAGMKALKKGNNKNSSFPIGKAFNKFENEKREMKR